MKVSCQRCGKRVEAKYPTKKWCSDSCRTEAYKERKAGVKPAEVVAKGGDLTEAIRLELVELDLVESSLGRQALTMATILESAITGHATISKELSRLMDEARAVGKQVVDPFDELQAWRERNRVSA